MTDFTMILVIKKFNDSYKSSCTVQSFIKKGYANRKCHMLGEILTEQT